MSAVWEAIRHWLATTGSMIWQITWSFILGFTLSAISESLVRKSTISRLARGAPRPDTGHGHAHGSAPS